MKKTLVVKNDLITGRSTGKRHGSIIGKGFKLNARETILANIEEQINQAEQTPPDKWRFWQISDELIIEKIPGDNDFIYSPTMYYLPGRHWRVSHYRSMFFDEEIDWSIDIADIAYDSSKGVWLLTDLFVDVIVRPDNQTHTVLDLDDLAEVFESCLISSNKVSKILRYTQNLIEIIRSGEFPPKEITEAQKTWLNYQTKP